MRRENEIKRGSRHGGGRMIGSERDEAGEQKRERTGKMNERGSVREGIREKANDREGAWKREKN